MREILFKGKRIDNGEWTEGYVTRMHRSDKNEVESYYFNARGESGFVAECIVCAETVCQYTGLTDKNGRKIFEGDILRSPSWIRSHRFNTDICVCRWNYPDDATNMQGFGMFSKTKLICTDKWDEFEVVGNIFENPELVNGGM